MSYILLIMLLLNTSLFYSIIFNKKIEQTLFFSIFSYIFILFITGLFSVLNIGFNIIIFINLILLFLNIKKIIKNKEIIIQNFFTNGLIAILIGYIIILWISIGKKASSWDEFSHWALVVKNMFNLNNFGLGNDSTVMVKSYLSGTSLFQYFCTKLNGTFNESFLYIGMDLTLLSTLIPMFSKFKKKLFIESMVLFFILFFLPVIFNSTVYSTLYVDVILGLTFGYTIYSYYTYRENNKLNKFDLFNLSASFSMLILIKDFGLVLLLISFGIILIDNTFIKNKFQIKKFFKNNLYILMSLIPPIFIKFAWIIIQKINNVSSASGTGGITAFLKNLIFGNIQQYQKGVIVSFADATLNNSLTSTFMPLSYILIIFISIIFGYFIIRNSNSKESKSIKILLIFLTLGAIGYASALLLAYLSIFSEYEATKLASFTRYMGSYSIGMLITMIMLSINCYSKNDKNLSLFVVILLSLFLVNFNFSNVTSILTRSSISESKEVRKNYKTFSKKTKKYMKKSDKLYFISTNDNGIDYYISRFELTPYKMSDNTTGWSIGTPYSKDDIWTIYKTADVWEEELKKNYTHVYLFDIDEQFIKLYGSLFIEPDNIKDNQLYKVLKNNSNEILQLVE